MAEREEATNAADTLHRHGEPDPSKWDEATAVTGRPQDEPAANTTFAERAKRPARRKAVTGAEAENKSVTTSESKTPAKRTTRKK